MVVRFFLWAALRNTIAAFGWPGATVPLRCSGPAPTEQQRLPSQPLSAVVARSGLSCPPPYPLSGAAFRCIFLSGAGTPLLFSAPAWALARRFIQRSAKAHRVSAVPWLVPLPAKAVLEPAPTQPPPPKARPPPLATSLRCSASLGRVSRPGATGRTFSHSFFVLGLNFVLRALTSTIVGRRRFSPFELAFGSSRVHHVPDHHPLIL